MSDQIPPEVLTKILIQCEIPTILRCRCVSKHWRAIIDDTHFIKQHTDYSIKTNSNRLFYVKPFGNLCYSSLDYLESLHVPIISEVRPVSLVGSCNGLLCFRNAKQNQDFCMMNPTTRKQIYLQGLFPKDDETRVFFTGYGFGYDCVGDDYKVVRIARKELDSDACNAACTHSSNMVCIETEMSICYVKTRVLKVVKMPYYHLGDTSGVFAGGALHWLMGKYKKYSDLSSPNEMIVGYDLRTDEFQELQLPTFVNDNWRLSLGLLGTLVCISAIYNTDEGLDFWVMKEYGVKESWTKFFSFSLDLSYYFVRPLGLSQRGSLVLVELDGRRLVWYDREEKKVMNFSQKLRDESIVCLSSLAPLPSNENGKINEKNQCSDSENRKKTRKKNKDDFLSKGFKLKL